MAKYNKITPEIIKAVQSYLEHPIYGQLPNNDIARLVGTSATTVSRIKQGKYDENGITYASETKSTSTSENPSSETTKYEVGIVMTYTELEELQKYKRCVEELLSRAALSNSDASMLYIPRKAIHWAIHRYFPDLVEARVKEVNEAASNDYTFLD